MKFIHTSDLHIGITLFGKELLEYQEQLAQNISQCAKKHSAEYIIIAGDVYDSSIVTREAVKCWDRFCTRLFSGKDNLKGIVISGNHDSAPRLSVCSELLKTCGLNIRGSFRSFLEPVECGDTQIYCIPYFNLSEARAVFNDCGIISYTDAFFAMTDKIRDSWDSSKKHVIAAHCFTAGAAASDSDRTAKGVSVSAGGAQLVSADVFAGFDYAALGHLHRAQDIKCPSDPKTRIRYSGTPLPYSFSEGEQEKSFTVFDTATGELFTETFPLPYRLASLKGTYEEIMSHTEEIPDDTYVRIILTDRSTSAGTYDAIKKKYPRMLRLERTPVKAFSDKSDIARRVEEMSMTELAESYLSNMLGKHMTDETKRWLEEAVREE